MKIGSINERIKKRQEQYYRLSVQVSVVTTLVVVYAVQTVSSKDNELIVFLLLLVTGHLGNIFSPPSSYKYVLGFIAIVGGVGSFAFDPSGSTAIAAGAGVMSGGLSFVSTGYDMRTQLERAIDRILTIHIVYRISEFLEATNWKSSRSMFSSLTLSSRIDSIEKKDSGVRSTIVPFNEHY